MLELFVAMKHIRTRKRQTLLAVGAVGLAVAIIIVFRAIMNGSIDTFFSLIFELAPHVLVLPKEGEEYIYLYKTLIEFVWTIPGVAAVSPALSGTAALAFEGNVENVEMTGGVPAEMNKVMSIEKYMIEGDFYSIASGRRVVLGDKVAEKLGVKIGEGVVASFPDAKTMNLVVAGIFRTGVEEWDGAAFVSLGTAREFVGDGDVINYINIHLQDPYQADAVAEEISARGYEAESWRSLFPEFEKTLAFETLSNNLILALVLLIASFGIANVMNMLVLEKTRDVGMLMAMGADSSAIRRIFVIESGILGLAGGIAGSASGYLISAYLHSLQITITAPNAPQPIVFKFLVDPFDLIAFPLLALVLSMIAGVYPAHRASQLDPVVALRG
ncbi:ABC transporter, permease protein [Methanothrix harundinacea 6Ac]|uniref:ABC transporter, permease protein n=1 Tax=Methanothrix harundinacea (strain 6Ac) TaxID=1110509 RepID=G7WQB2_METH6|nr:ABC transporter, permease protein [Methanothrix harundinacea 6Ac]